MDDITRDQTSLVLDTSLEFVLIGPSGSHRRALIRSRGRTADLLGLDQQGIYDDERTMDNEPVKPFSLILRREPRRYIVSSRSRPIIDPKMGDRRSAYYSFAWRGLASSSTIHDIEKLFNLVIVDILEAVKKKNFEEIEWQLSPLILLCERGNEKLLNQSSILRFALASMIVLYVLAGLGSFLSILLRGHSW